MSEKQFNNPLTLASNTEFFGKNGDEFGKFNAGFLGLHNLMHVQDRKTSGTNGGNFVSGAWRTRDLNTIVTNNIIGASLALNVVTIPSGVYFAMASVAAHYITRHVSRIYDDTHSALLVPGIQEYASNALGDGFTSRSWACGSFSIAEQSNISLQHYCGATNANGFGVAANIGIEEIYSDLKIWKLS